MKKKGRREETETYSQKRKRDIDTYRDGLREIEGERETDQEKGKQKTK